MPFSIEQQHQQKCQRVTDAFARREETATPLPWTAPPIIATRPLAYRNRLRLRVDDGHLVFFNADKEQSCAVLTPALRDAITRLRSALDADLEHAASIKHVEVREADADGTPGVHIVWHEPHKENAMRERLAGWSTELQRFWLTEAVYTLVPVDAFRQVHDATAQVLVRAVVASALERGVRRFADLYAGCGSFALPLLHQGLIGVAVESHAGAVRAMQRAAKEQGLDGLTCVADEVAHALQTPELLAADFDAVIANPPRAGLRTAGAALAKLGAKYVVLICCDPESIARDAEQLRAFGYQLSQIQCFDMFPQTAHVETVAWLQNHID